MKQTREKSLIVGPRQLLVLSATGCTFPSLCFSNWFLCWWLCAHPCVWLVPAPCILPPSLTAPMDMRRSGQNRINVGNIHPQPILLGQMLVEQPVQQLVYGCGQSCSILPSLGADWLHQVIFLSLDLKTRAGNLRAAHAASTSSVAHHGRKRSSLWSNYATVMYSSMHFPTLSNKSTGSLK